MRARQQLLRALITDIIADVDEAVREVILTIHWRAASIRNCGCVDQRPGNMAAVRPTKLWR